ncbi:MAG: T9SS type A sorting domain-containing protein [Bacteroidota bacterium]
MTEDSKSIYSIASNDDYVFVAGNFTYIGPNTGNGNVVSTISGAVGELWPQPNGTVYAAEPDGNGGWYIGGDFTQVGTVSVSRLAHLLPNRSVDESWLPNPNNIVRKIVLDASGLYVGGSFQNIAGADRNGIARFHLQDHSLSNWDAGTMTNPSVFDLLIIGDDLYAGGNFTLSGLQRLVRIDTASGAVDGSWTPNPNAQVWTLAGYNNSLYVGGQFTQIFGANNAKFAKVDMANSTLLSWADLPNNNVYDILLEGPHVFVAGTFSRVGTNTINSVAKFDSTTGTTVSLWDINTFSPTAAIHTLISDGTYLYAGGAFTRETNTGADRLRMIKVTVDNGTLVSGWASHATGPVWALASDGTELYVGGAFNSIGGYLTDGLARLHRTTGAGDPGFVSSSNNGIIYDLQMAGDSLFLAGSFGSFHSTFSRRRLACVKANTGTLEFCDWEPSMGSSGIIYDMALAGNQLYLGGQISFAAGSPINNLARIDLTGSATVDADWMPNVSGTVFSLLPDGDDLYIGGSFSDVESSGISRLAKLSTVDVSVSSWNPSLTSGTVYDMASFGDELFVGGSFVQIGAQNRNRIAQINKATGVVSDWNANLVGSRVNVMQIEDSFLYLGGVISSAGGIAVQNLARVTAATGQADGTWSPAADGSVETLHTVGGEFFIGGSFSSLNSRTFGSLGGFSFGSILPVRWGPFRGKEMGDAILLQWTTYQEHHNQGFWVERATDGRHFQALGWRPSLGDSGTPQHYQFVDESPAFRNYYRLVQWDEDGTKDYSHILSIMPSQDLETTFQLFPNPTVDSFQISNDTQVTQVRLVDHQGREVRKFEASLGLPFDLRGLPAGVYQVIVETTTVPVVLLLCKTESLSR